MLPESGNEIMMPIVKPNPSESLETVDKALSKEYTGGWEEYYW